MSATNHSNVDVCAIRDARESVPLVAASEVREDVGRARKVKGPQAVANVVPLLRSLEPLPHVAEVVGAGSAHEHRESAGRVALYEVLHRADGVAEDDDVARVAERFRHGDVPVGPFAREGEVPILPVEPPHDAR